jgi:hypothetical protein
MAGSRGIVFEILGLPLFFRRQHIGQEPDAMALQAAAQVGARHYGNQGQAQVVKLSSGGRD